MNTRDEIIKGLEPLFKEADEKGLWFHCNYQGFNLSPKELRKEHDNGRLVWGTVNWNLIDPKTLLKDEESEIQKVKSYNQSILNRINDK